MIDSHCHLADEAFAEDRAAVVERATAAGVQRALCILAAGDQRESAAAADVRRLWPAVRFSTGVHPHQAGDYSDRVRDVIDVVATALSTEGSSAVGEIGLDYHYDFAPRDVQQAVFATQVGMARDRRLPVVIHSREATEDTFRILRQTGMGRVRGVFHCFTGDRAMARRVLDLGFHISIAGIITFPRATEIREALRLVPDDRLLIETDAPYLAPVPHRGKRNEPAFVADVLDQVAALRGAPTDVLAAQLVRNFDDLFGANVSPETA
jgi:TatD DNase family protein